MATGPGWLLQKLTRPEFHSSDVRNQYLFVFEGEKRLPNWSLPAVLGQRHRFLYVKGIGKLPNLYERKTDRTLCLKAYIEKKVGTPMEGDQEY